MVIGIIVPAAAGKLCYARNENLVVSGSCFHFFVSLYLKCVVKSEGITSTI